MIIFTSAYEHTIDAKNRLAIPAQFREKIDPKRDGHRLYLVPGTRPNTLWIYTEKHFEAITEQFGTGMVRDQNIVEFEQEAFPDICEVEPDSQGRIVIPERVLQSAGLGSEVVVCGVRDHMEVWRRDEWEKRRSGGRSSFAELLAKAREAIVQEENRKGITGRQGPI